MEIEENLLKASRFFYSFPKRESQQGKDGKRRVNSMLMNDEQCSDEQYYIGSFKNSPHLTLFPSFQPLSIFSI
jgi:hypothetical protein